MHILLHGTLQVVLNLQLPFRTGGVKLAATPVSNDIESTYAYMPTYVRICQQDCNVCCTPLHLQVSFSTAGGVEIEENWDKVSTITIPTATPITGARGAVVCVCDMTGQLRGWVRARVRVRVRARTKRREMWEFGKRGVSTITIPTATPVIGVCVMGQNA